MTRWLDEVQTHGSVAVPPDLRTVAGLGRNHSLETALADLVDNSIDAGASHVVIRFIRRDGRLRALYVADNGRGIAPESIDRAMTVGGRRTYEATDLGHFGLGLKAASFSQARSLTVISRAAERPVVGRRWNLESGDRGFEIDIVRQDFADAEFARGWAIPGHLTGTIVRWDDVTGFPATADTRRIEEYLAGRSAAIRDHLGLVFHRIIALERVVIGLEVEDVETGVGPRFIIKPLDPFAYPVTGRAGYPKVLTAPYREHTVRLDCHIWPGRSTRPEFRLPDGGAERHQGIFFYRRDRLLQAGDEWAGIIAPNKRLQLARISIDIDDSLLDLFTMNAEKSKVIPGPDFTYLAESARAPDGSALPDYLADAESAFRESRKRSSARKPLHFPPGKGFAPKVRRTIADEFDFLEPDDPIDVRWRRFPGDTDDFFELDRTARTLWLNERFRSSILGSQRGGLNDAPLLKALLYLTFEDLFRGERLGARDKDTMELLQEILTAAAKSGLT